MSAKLLSTTVITVFHRECIKYFSLVPPMRQITLEGDGEHGQRRRKKKERRTAEKEIRDKESDGKVTFLAPRAIEKETDFSDGLSLFVKRKLDFPEGPAGESMRTSQIRPPQSRKERLLTVRSKHQRSDWQRLCHPS